MSDIRISTYNINSVRLRIDLVLQYLRENEIDIICLQETKVEDNKFPMQKFVDSGYDNILFSGEKSYNGVAIISRIPIEEKEIKYFCKEDKRDISAILPDGTVLYNFYIPAGGDEPDVKLNPKFVHKLSYVDCLTEYFTNTYSAKDKIIAVGDFNIAPYENDVWSHKQLLKVVSHTPIEVEKLNNFKKSIEFVDIAREFVSEDEKLYSWWSYRNRDWRKSNRGRRLDHIWLTKSLAKKVKDFQITDEMRDRYKPSDHVPVSINISI